MVITRSPNTRLVGEKAIALQDPIRMMIVITAWHEGGDVEQYMPCTVADSTPAVPYKALSARVFSPNCYEWAHLRFNDREFRQRANQRKQPHRRNIARSQEYTGAARSVRAAFLLHRAKAGSTINCCYQAWVLKKSLHECLFICEPAGADFLVSV